MQISFGRPSHKIILALLCAAMVLGGCKKDAAFSDGKEESPRRISVLILPKFEIGEMTGDDPGEAQYYYDAYVKGGKAYEIRGGAQGSRLYVKDDIALCVTGMGKANAAASMEAVLLDERFDFSDAYILSTGG